MVSEQLTFDFTPSKKRLELNCTVRVLRPPNGADCETEFYVGMYAGKKGKLVNILKGATAVSFEVDFGTGRTAIFTENELEAI